jgi:anti-sigma regulatory factor (Ser/Thr protein kinase)/GNAT superfamily N-acetyltransferase
VAGESAAPTVARPIARISVAADPQYLPAALAFLREAATRLGLAQADVAPLERAVQEVATNVIAHGFLAGQAGTFDVVLSRRPGQLVVAVEDQGLPFDWSALESATGAGPAGPSLTGFADQVHFQSLGPGGNRVEIVKRLPFAHIDAFPASEAPAVAAPSPPPVSTQPVTLRAMTADDAIAVARCTYAVYGYTVPDEFLYFPDRVKEMLTGGLLEVCVAATPDGEIVACLTRELERPGAAVGYLGEGMVDPRFRGHGLMERLLTFTKDRAAAQGLRGLYGEAVTVHPYSQKSNLALGFSETGVELGDESSAVVFKDIDDRAQKKRTATVIEYLPMGTPAGRVVYPPARHRDITERIYRRGKFERTLATAPAGTAGLPAHAQVGVQVFPQWGEALMRVTSYGADLVDVVRVRLRELCRRRIDWIAIELPLSDPGAGLLCDGLEGLGFFFAGIVPELADDDVLRLQYLNEVEADVESAQIASDFGRELFTYVVRAMQTAPGAGA